MLIQGFVLDLLFLLLFNSKTRKSPVLLAQLKFFVDPLDSIRGVSLSSKGETPKLLIRRIHLSSGQRLTTSSRVLFGFRTYVLGITPWYGQPYNA